MSAIKKYLIKKLAAKAGYSPEELPMSVSEPRLMEDLRRGLAPMIPGGPYQRGEASRLDIKFPIQPKTKTKKPSSVKEKKISGSPDSTILMVKPEGGQSNERAIKKALVKSLGEKEPLTGKPKFKIPTKQKKPEFPFTPIEAVQQKTDEGLVTILRERISPPRSQKEPITEKDVSPNIVQTSDRSGVRPVVVGTEISRETGKRLGQRKPYDTGVIYDEQPMPGVNVNYPDRPSSRRKHPDDQGFAESGFIKMGDLESSTQIDSPAKVPVTKAELNPVQKEVIKADPGFPSKTDQEFFDKKVQDYLDEGDDFVTARARASDDIQERNLSELTVDQLRDKMGKGSVDSPIKMDDIKLSRSIDKGQPRSDTEGLATLVTDKLGDIRGAEYKVNKKKAGRQVGKPKRKIKKSVRGNDLVAMMYD